METYCRRIAKSIGYDLSIEQGQAVFDCPDVYCEETLPQQIVCGLHESREKVLADVYDALCYTLKTNFRLDFIPKNIPSNNFIELRTAILLKRILPLKTSEVQALEKEPFGLLLMEYARMKDAVEEVSC